MCQFQDLLHIVPGRRGRKLKNLFAHHRYRLKNSVHPYKWLTCLTASSSLSRRFCLLVSLCWVPADKQNEPNSVWWWITKINYQVIACSCINYACPRGEERREMSSWKTSWHHSQYKNKKSFLWINTAWDTQNTLNQLYNNFQCVCNIQ